MNFKNMLVPLLLGTFFAITFRYFFVSDSDNLQAERSRVAPVKEEINRPLEFDVDFIDSDLGKKYDSIDVETKFSKLTFTEFGGTLEKAYFKHEVGGDVELLQTIESLDSENQCFLLALQGPTPLAYKLIHNSEDEESITVSYESVSSSSDLFQHLNNERNNSNAAASGSVDASVKILKQFKIYKNIPKLDLQISLKSSKDSSFVHPMRMRLFFNSPFLKALKDDKIQGIANDGKYIVKRSIDIAKEGRYWEQPTLFGSENRYFVNTMVGDVNKFVNRAYYKISDTGSSLISILESSKIDSGASWVLSFYFGPKKVSLMQSVDPRLSGTLEFGMWEPLCLPLLKLLNFFYSYAKNYGVAIILLTLLIKLLLFPFTWRGQRNLQNMSNKQKEFQDKMEYFKKKYKDDPQALQRAQADLLKTHALPGMGGCLGMLLNIPVFFALQRVLANAVELYQAPFLWIHNLSAPDPYYILPILTGIGMIWSGIGSTTSKKSDPKQKLVSYFFALIFTAVTFSLSSGLVLYLALNAILITVQNFLQSKLTKA
jgi:YidC/Oxa1 family membrane protein insertase